MFQINGAQTGNGVTLFTNGKYLKSIQENGLKGKRILSDFNGVDVTGKIILRLRGYIGHSDKSSIAFKKFKAIRTNIYWNRF
jgi:hypothetical protein